jgi:WD40-like Beta Propeller Repeat
MSHLRAGVAVAGLALFAALAAPAAATPVGSNGQIVWQREYRNAFPQLRIANPDGSGVRNVFHRAGRGEFEGSFSPTEPNTMVFSRFGERPFSEEIFVGNLATGAVTRIRRPRTADFAPTVSPDGTRIAYFTIRRPKDLEAEGPPPAHRIRVMGVDGSDDRAISPPDGQTIVFEQLRERGNRSDIASMGAAGGPVPGHESLGDEPDPLPGRNPHPLHERPRPTRPGPARTRVRGLHDGRGRHGHRPADEQPVAGHLPGLAAHALDHERRPRQPGRVAARQPP